MNNKYVKIISDHLNEVRYNEFPYNVYLFLGDKYDASKPCPKDKCVISKNYKSIINYRHPSYLCRTGSDISNKFVCRSISGFRAVKLVCTKDSISLLLSSYIKIQVRLDEENLKFEYE